MTRRYVTLLGADGQRVTAEEGSTIVIDIPIKINTASDSRWGIKGHLTTTWEGRVVDIGNVQRPKRWWRR